MKRHTAGFLIFDFKKAKITIFGSKMSFFGLCEKSSLTFFFILLISNFMQNFEKIYTSVSDINCDAQNQKNCDFSLFEIKNQNRAKWRCYFY